MDKPRCFGSFGTFGCISRPCRFASACRKYKTIENADNEVKKKLDIDNIPPRTVVYAPLPNGNIDKGWFMNNNYYNALHKNVGLYSTEEDAKRAGELLGWSMN